LAVAFSHADILNAGREETRTQPQAIKAALVETNSRLLKRLAWWMRRNPDGWSLK